MANTCTSSLAGFSRRAVRPPAAAASPCARRSSSLPGLGASWSAAPRFYPDDPIWSDDDRAFDASKVVAIEDTNGYDFVVNTFSAAGRAPRRARAERQHGRRSARFELVHQPDRPPRHDRRRRGQGPRPGRAGVARRLGRVGRQELGRAAGLPNDGSRRASSIRSRWTRRRIPSWRAAPRSSGPRSITPSATTRSTSTWRRSIARRSSSRSGPPFAIR